MKPVTSIPRSTWPMTGALLLIACVWAACFFRYDGAPLEDAAMLLRYAQHWAQGHGIVWNLGEAPLDGATDFGLMAIVVGLQRLGLEAGLAVRVLAMSAHLATVLLLFIAPQRWLGAPRWAAALAALSYAFGPGPAFVEAYFGTPVFAFALALAWALGLRAVRSGSAWTFFGAACLATSLIRPEGVLLTALMAGLLTLGLGRRQSHALLGAWAFWVLLLGGLYFGWRWSYFGHPLPNPFYKKGGGHFYASSAREAFFQVLRFLGPWGAVLALGALGRRRRLALLTLMLLAGGTLMWGLLSNEMNYQGRFQYPLLALGLMTAPSLLEIWRPASWPKGWRALALLCALALACLSSPFLNARSGVVGDSRADVGRALQPFAVKGYRMAVTEAGLLPYYSQWRALDAWGLNDARIARRGQLETSDLEAFQPDLIMVHAYFPPWALPAEAGGWDGMCLTLYRWASAHGYVVAAVYGSTDKDVHAYLLKPGLPDEVALRQALHTGPYAWYSNGQVVPDLAAAR